MKPTKFKSFTGMANAHAAVAKSPARGIRYAVRLDGETLQDGSRVFRYFPTFLPATGEQRMIVEKCRFRCADDVAKA